MTMSDQDDTAPKTPERDFQHSRPPSPDDTAESKASRKREREVSLEPSTPQTPVIDIDPEHAGHKERRTPAKKNRVSAQLDPTEEEDEDSVQSCSPPHDIKIRQISQGVEDITWQNMHKEQVPDVRKDHDMDVAYEQEDEKIEAKVAEGEEIAVPPAMLQGENPPIIAEEESEMDQGGAADPAEVPPDAQLSDPEDLTSAEMHPEVSSTSTIPPISVSPSQTPASPHIASHPIASPPASPRQAPASPLQAPLSSPQAPDPLPQAPASPPQAPASPNQAPASPTQAPESPLQVPLTPPLSRRGSESDQEKGVKRKLADRTVSERLVPEEVSHKVNGVVPAASTGATKRPRDDPEADANPRVTKRPTPPPDEGTTSEKSEKAEKAVEKNAGESTAEKKTPPSSTTVTPKLGGFMAYASTNSPFASVSGASIFGSKNASPSSSAWASTSTSPHPSPNLTVSPFSSIGSPSSPFKPSEKSVTSQLAHKRTGFEAFASSTSPFASVAKRPKSPPPLFGRLARSRSPTRPASTRATNAFSAYAAGGAQSFSAHSTPRRGSPVLAEAVEGQGKPAIGLGILDGNGAPADEDGACTFGERLRAQKDGEEQSDEGQALDLHEQEIPTGEEDEQTVCQVRGKLFTLDSGAWKERGMGIMRLNVRRDNGTGARLIMRKDAVYTVILNAPLFKGMQCQLQTDHRYFRFSMFEGTTTTHFNLRLQSAKNGKDLADAINKHIPTD